MSKIKKIILPSILVISLWITSVLPANASYTFYCLGYVSYANYLNCYTSGNVVSGTLVSTWTLTKNPSQRWEVWKETSGGWSLRPVANTTVALNANRSNIGTTANVLTASTNYAQDYCLLRNPQTSSLIELSARGAHSQRVVLYATGESSLCVWNYNVEPFYQMWANFE